jgi:Na+/melibiose symporter-like transporter
MEKERGIKITNINKDTNKNGVLHSVIAFLVKLTPFLIGVPILCVLNYMCYEANDRLLQPATNLVWLGIMTMFWFKYYK